MKTKNKTDEKKRLNNLIDYHQDDVCDCGAPMDMFRTRHPEEGYDYLEWICTNDDCGHREDRHEDISDE